MKSTRIGAVLAGVVLAGTGSTAAHADAIQPPSLCPPDLSVSITSKTSYHIPSGPVFKDGPGGNISVSVVQAATISATISSSAEVSINEIIAAGKVSVGASITKSVSITVGHVYNHDITANKYGNAQYGSWGYNVNWQKTRDNGNCKGVTVLATGTAKLPTSSLGWKYWETS